MLMSLLAPRAASASIFCKALKKQLKEMQQMEPGRGMLPPPLS